MYDAQNHLANLSIEELAKLIQQTQAENACEESAGRLGNGQEPRLEDTVVDIPIASYTQERLWFMDKLAPGNPFYNIPFGIRIEGALNEKAFSEAWKDVLERHAPLRSLFRDGANGIPEVVYLSPEQMPLTVSGPEAAGRIAQLMDKEADTGFDLSKGQLIRGTLIPESMDAHILLFTVHHIIFDGWSITVFLNDLFTAYAARLERKKPGWDKLPVTYEQFAVWHRREIQNIAAEETQWWREHLANLPDLDIPTDFPRPEQQSFRGKVHVFNVSHATADKLENLAREQGVTSFAVWLAVFSVVLARHSGQTDFAVGSSFAARGHEGVESLVGFFVENLCIRPEVDLSLSFRDFVKKAGQAAITAIEHGKLPFQLLAEASGRQRDLSKNPVYQAAFTYQNMPSGTEVPGNLKVNGLVTPLHATHMDLEVLAWPDENGMCCQLLYATDIFRDETVRRIADDFLAVASAAADNSDTLTASLGLGNTLSLYHGTMRPYDVIEPFRLFAGLCAEAPDAAAVILEKGDEEAAQNDEGDSGSIRARKTSRAELMRLVDLFCKELLAAKVGKGDVAAVRLEQGPELLAALLAIWRIGAAWTCIIPESPSVVAEWILNNAQASCLITRGEFWAERSEAGAKSSPEQKADNQTDATSSLKVIFVESLAKDTDQTDLADQNVPVVSLAADDLACIFYTSGSTGRPKGVSYSHKGVANRLQWMWEQFPWQKGEVAIQKTSPVFTDFLWEAFGPLLSGVPLVVTSSKRSANVSWLVECLERNHVSRLVIVPSLLAEFHIISGGLFGRLPALRWISASGEPLSPSLASATLKALPSVRLLNLYGSTEVTADATWHRVSPDGYAGTVSIGTPIHNTSVAIVDEQQNILPRGAVGELYVSGACLAKGYHNYSGERQNAFIRSHSDSTEKNGSGKNSLPGNTVWFATGDLAKMDAGGQVYHFGRKDRQLKIRGMRIEPDEIQSVLETHPLVREARVIGVNGGIPQPQSAPGQSSTTSGSSRQNTRQDTRLAAYIIPQSEEADAGSQADHERCMRQWEALYDSMYSVVRSQGDILDNFFIWQSIYTGTAIPQNEMSEWLDCTLESINRLQPKTVLEIGCGQGFLLMNLAQQCQCYVGTDISAEALRCLEELLSKRHESEGRKLPVELVHAEATQLPDIEPGKFDTAVVNSVVQYFPDHTYLKNTIVKALPLLGKNAKFFLGDIRNFSALNVFHTAVQFYQSPEDLSIRKFLDNVYAKKRMENELLVAPLFWHNLRQLSGRIVHAEVSPKVCESDNEVTQFRYDVVLHLDSAAHTFYAGTHASWGKNENGINCIQSLGQHLSAFMNIAGTNENSTAVLGIPNAHISEFRLLEGLAEELGLVAPETSLCEVKQQVSRRLTESPTERGLYPYEIKKLAAKYDLDVNITIDPRDGLSLNALFYPAGTGPFAISSDLLLGEEKQSRSAMPGKNAANLARFVNTSARSRDETKLRAQLREYLGANLSAYMMPDVFLTLEEWPRTPSGKIDWMRLPSPNMRTFTSTAGMQRASTTEEKNLADIWKLVIGIDEVSVHDNFFEIGGTSLLLTQVHHMIQNRLAKKFPLTTLFQYPTIHSFIQWLQSPAQEKKEDHNNPGKGREILLRKHLAIREQRQQNQQMNHREQ